MKNPLDKGRFRAALTLRGRGLQDAADAAECSYQHLNYVLMGERKPSERLLGALRAYLGESAWAWVTRQSNISPDTSPST